MRGWPVKLGPISKRGAVKFARPNPLFVEIVELGNLHVRFDDWVGSIPAPLTTLLQALRRGVVGEVIVFLVLNDVPLRGYGRKNGSVRVAAVNENPGHAPA